MVLAAQAYATKRDVLIELSLAAGSMSRETKEEIIRAAYLTLLADKRIATEERKNSKMSPSRCRFPRINSTRSYEQLNLR